MTDSLEYINAIMPYNSGFEGSDLYRILDETLGKYLDDLLENRIDKAYNSNFITLATGEDLDKLGRLYGVARGNNEDDKDYRLRIGFQADKMVNLDNLLDLGCEVYSYVNGYDLGSTLLSRNITEASKVLVVAPNESVKQTLLDNIFLKSVVIV